MFGAFTNDVTVERNSASGSGCSGIWMFGVNDFEVERNTVEGSVDCANIDVVASTGGTIARNTAAGGGFAGINVDDVSDVVLDRNSANGNCLGIVAADSPGPFTSNGVTIRRNTTTGNNTVCYPFGPDIPIGVTGILVAGPSNVVVERNVANDNASTEFSVTAAGILITDFPNDDGTVNATGEVIVRRNTMSGNTSAVGPVDLSITTIGGPVTVKRNHCSFGVSAAGPEPSWCGN